MDQQQPEELIIDDRVNGIFRVNRRAFTDPAIFEIEKREVFDRSWLYAGHISEIAKPGDFVTRRVGGRPLILVCDRVGAPHALLNSCPHRGNIVCRERAGSAAQNFVCFYHAWNFDLDGSLVGVPDEQSYAPAFDRGAMGLRPAPRFENYKGMLFVNFDPAADDLVSFLGNAREYLDYMLDFGGDDVEIVPGAQAYSMKANWKLLIENSIDGYHAMATHHRYFVQLPDRYRRRHQRLGRPAPAVGHRAGAGRRPQRHRESAAPDADHDQRQGRTRPHPREAGREIRLRAGPPHRRFQPQPVHLPEPDPDLELAHDPHLVSAGARLHRDRRLGGLAARRLAGIAPEGATRISSRSSGRPGSGRRTTCRASKAASAGSRPSASCHGPTSRAAWRRTSRRARTNCRCVRSGGAGMR